MNFNLRDYWENRYKTRKKTSKGYGSGIGSEGKENEYKTNYVNDFIAKNNIKTVIDYGCGAGNFTIGLTGFEHYIGYDISQSCIDFCINRFKNRDNLTFTTDTALLSSDYELGLSIDVLFHQVNDNDYIEHLMMLFRHKYVIIYSHDTDENKIQNEHVLFRKISKTIAEMFPNYRLTKAVYGYESKKFMIYKMR